MPGRRRDSRAPSTYPRIARVNEVLREVVADALERCADSDERLRLVTVTGVATTPDLARATVYLSSLPEGAANALRALRPRLQSAIGHEVRMKRTPHLEFAVDPAVVEGTRVEEVLRRIHGAGTADGGAGTGDGGTGDGDGATR